MLARPQLDLNSSKNKFNEILIKLKKNKNKHFHTSGLGNVLCKMAPILYQSLCAESSSTFYLNCPLVRWNENHRCYPVHNEEKHIEFHE